MPFTPVEVLSKIVEESVVDTRLRSAVTLDLLKAKGRTTTANYSALYWDVVVSSGTAAWDSMANAAAGSTVGQTVQANLGLGGYKVTHKFSLSRVTLRDAASRGPGELKDLLKTHVDDGLLVLRRKVNEAIWLGDGTATYGGFVGMPVILSNTASYAGIDPATYTSWKPGVLLTNGTPRALTKDLLLDFRQAEVENEVMHDFVVTSPATAKSYNKLFDSIAGSLQIANSQGGRSNIDVATGDRAWDGIAITEDPICPSGQIVTGALNYFDLKSYDLSNVGKDKMSQLGFQDNFTVIKSAEVGGLCVNIAMIPEVNPGTLTFEIFVIPQLRLRNRKMIQGIKNLT